MQYDYTAKTFKKICVDHISNDTKTFISRRRGQAFVNTPLPPSARFGVCGGSSHPSIHPLGEPWSPPCFRSEIENISACLLGGVGKGELDPTFPPHSPFPHGGLFRPCGWGSRPQILPHLKKKKVQMLTHDRLFVPQKGQPVCLSKSKTKLSLKKGTQTVLQTGN